MDQIIENGSIFIVNEDQLLKQDVHSKVQNEFKESKIIALFILSRHKRGKKNNKTITNDADPRNFTFYYKVFIEYSPVNKKENLKKQYKNIKSIF